MNTIAMFSQLRKTALRGTISARGKHFASITLAIFASFLFAFLAPQQLRAQAQNTGTIYGSAVDPSGAVVPKATVTATSTSTGAVRTVTTGKSGEYTLQNLGVDTYTVTFAAPGFEAYVVDGVTVDADSNVKVLGKLVIGTSDQVTVTNQGNDVDARS